MGTLMKNSMMSRGRGASNGVSNLEVQALERQTTVVQTCSSRDGYVSPALRSHFKAISAGVMYLAAAALLVLFATVVPATAQMTQELQMGVESHRAGNFRDAIEIYSAVITKNKQSAEAYNWRGMAYEEMNQLDQALDDLNEAIRLSPKYADAYNNRGEVYRKKNMLREALADYRKATGLDKTFAEAHYNIGLVSEAEGNGAPAARAYTEYLKLKPNAEDKEEVQAKIAVLQKTAAQEPKPPAPTVTPPGAQQPKVPAPGVTPPGTAQPAVPKPGAPKVASEKKPPPKPGQPLAPLAPPGFDQGVPGIPGIPPELGTILTGMGYMSMIVNILFYVFTSLMLFFIANKTGTALPWLAFIPIANIYLMVRIAGKPIWWLALLLLLPVLAVVFFALSVLDPTGGILASILGIAAFLVCIVAWLFVDLGIANARGKSTLWGVLLFIPCTSPIALGYLGLSK